MWPRLRRAPVTYHLLYDSGNLEEEKRRRYNVTNYGKATNMNTFTDTKKNLDPVSQSLIVRPPFVSSTSKLTGSEMKQGGETRFFSADSFRKSFQEKD